MRQLMFFLFGPGRLSRIRCRPLYFDLQINLSIHTHPDQDHPVSLDIETGSLSGLYILRHLDLSYSSIWRLPHNELCGLQTLISLNMSHNSVKDVKDVGFFNDQDSCR